MLIIFEKVASIFLIIAVGAAAGGFKLVPEGTQTVISKLVMAVCLPCMVISSISSRELSRDMLSSTLLTMVVGCVFYALVSVIGMLLTKYVFKFPEEDLGVYILGFGSNNTGFLGFPITMAIFGDEVFYFMVLLNIVLTVYTNGLGPVLVNLGSRSESAGISLKSFMNPCMISILVGLIMLFCRLHLPGVLEDCVQVIGDSTTPLSLMVVGMKLAESKLGKMLKNIRLLSFAAIKMFVLPFVMFFAIDALPLPAEAKIAFIMASVYSTAVITSAVAETAGRNSALASEIVALTTCMALGAIPLAAVLLTGYYGL